MSSDDERLPELFVRGAAMYKAQLNAENPLGTMQSIEHALRGLDKAVADERERAARAEKMLGDFEAQSGKPFEHEARIKELLGRQAELNAALDLDKGERQIAPPAGEEEVPAGRSDTGADERASVVTQGPARSAEWQPRYRPDRIDEKNLDPRDKPASSRTGPIAPGTKF